jgi:hypothetical protein
MVLRQAGSIAAIIGARKSQYLSISLSDIPDADAMRMHESEAEVQQWGCWALIVSEKIRTGRSTQLILCIPELVF